MILRSDVFVDSISKIEILTTTRELLLGEPPEVCHIQAFDTEGKSNLVEYFVVILSGTPSLKIKWT